MCKVRFDDSSGTDDLVSLVAQNLHLNISLWVYSATVSDPLAVATRKIVL